MVDLEAAGDEEGRQTEAEPTQTAVTGIFLFYKYHTSIRYKK